MYDYIVDLDIRKDLRRGVVLVCIEAYQCKIENSFINLFIYFFSCRDLNISYRIDAIGTHRLWQ